MWGILEGCVKKALHYSTPLGYMWMFMLFTFRMFITAVVGGPVYGDESGNFKCDTNQPGCQNVCFNRFSPISHLRFWAFQMLFVCLPSVAFMTYAQFELQKIDVITKKEKEFIENAGDDESAYVTPEYLKIAGKRKKLGINKMKKKTTVTADAAVEVIWTPRIRFIYIIHLIFKLALECIFLYLSYLLQKQQSKRSGLSAMWVPEKYECTHGDTEDNSACSQNPLIPCWVSRPWEKTIFMLYMTAVTIISIILCLAEFVYVITRTTKKGVHRRAEKAISTKAYEKSMIDPGMKSDYQNGTIASSISSKGRVYPKLKMNGNGHIPNGNGHIPNGNGHIHHKTQEVPMESPPPVYEEERDENAPLVPENNKKATAPEAVVVEDLA